MNRDAVIYAAYLACRAIGAEPTRRNVQAMIKRICGHGFRASNIGDILAELHNPRYEARLQRQIERAP